MPRRARIAFAFLPLTVWCAAGSYNIATIAGSDWVGDNGPATSAILLQAEGIAVSLTGDIYIADAGNHRVRKISGGVITTFAGTGIAGFSGDGGSASAAQLNSPYGLALDGLGNLYIADLGNARVRKIGLDGTIMTVAGGGVLRPGAANGGSAATAMALSAPRNVAWDGRGSLYISDFTGQRVFRLAADGSLTTAAGTGAGGLSGDGGPAASAQVAFPAGLAVNRNGDLYIADSGNHVIRRISGALITTFARAATPTGVAFDSFGNFYVADPGAGEIIDMSVSGTVGVYPFNAQDVACGFDSSVYALSTGVAWHVLFSGPSPIIAGGGSLAHGDGGPATLARLNHPAGVASDALGNIYIADRDNHRIRRIDTAGNITTVAGTGSPGNGGDGGLATSAQLNSPESVTADPSGNLYIADTGNQRVRLVTASGLILPVSAANLESPVYALPDAHGNVFIADAGAGAIVRVSASQVTTVVAQGLASPRGLAMDSSGNLYVTESAGPHVRRFGTDGTIALIGEGSWNIPRGITAAPSGDLFVADTGLGQILHVDLTGNVTAVAGIGTPGFSGDGGAALSAQLNFPWDVAIDLAGNLDIADLQNNRIRQLTPAASVTGLLTVTAVNAASLLLGPIAPGMLIDILGSGVTSADTTGVTVDSISVPILSVSNGAILIQAPPQLAGSTAEIQVASHASVIAQVSIAVAPSAPALFADSSSQALANNQDGTLNSISNPAPRGSIVAFYGTGQGVAGLPVTATVGGYQANVLYSGPVANYPGLFQINVQIPAGYLAPGDLEVIISVGPATTQAGVMIAVN